MKCKKKTKSIVVAAALLVLGIGVFYGYRFAEKLMAWRHLDQTYSEDFASPAEIAPNLKGKKLVFHIRTGLDQDDSQICVGFNVIFAALEAGSDVTVLFDAGALLDLTAKRHNLEATGVPLRLQKVIAAQMNLPLEEMPSNYKEYLELLHLRGASFHANTAMLIVTGDHEKVKATISGYDFVEPVTYAGVANLLSDADTIIAY